ncbi:beta-lactamase-like protein [Crassisporium funariophilum]|nr:beta-lactamase-like protein [Crassisporium funariophilum]
MQNKEDLQGVTRLSEHVVRVLGQNPGKFTLQGTNTYLIGSSKPYILIDTAEGLPSYIPVLQSALQSSSAEPPLQPDISDILISHWHHDHVGGLPSVLELLKDIWVKRNPTSDAADYRGPKLHKYPLDEGKAGEHHGAYNKLPDMVEKLDNKTYTAKEGGGVFHDLRDGQVFQDQSNTPLLKVLHTPGHTIDSIALHIPKDNALYTADTVLGHGTAVFEDLATYLGSLNRMLHLGSALTAENAEVSLQDGYEVLYPGHGAVVTNGKETIATYIKHRLSREAQIIQVLQAPVPAELLDSSSSEISTFSSVPWTTWNIVRTLYKTYPESLWLPAARGIYLHLRKLEEEGSVRKLGKGEGKDQEWEWVTSSRVSTPSL